METPADLRYSREHEWVRLDGETAVVGITDFAQDQLGDIVYLSLPEPGALFAQFAKIGEIESVKSVSDLFAPIGGELVEVNQSAVDTPELVNQSPYGDGWLYKLRPSDPAEMDALLSADDYNAITTAGEH
jgi:glycine cleavage system H protein